ncbi:hypothetical protein AAFF39_03310 [Lactococcus garvieae]
MNINIIEDQMLVDLNENSTLVEWYNDYAKVKIIASNLSDGTKQKYDAFSNVIVKYFGDKPITAISPRDYQVVFNKLGKNVGRDYAQRINKLIEKVAQYAKDEGIPVKDFTKSLDIFEKRSKKDRDEKYLHSRKDFNTVLEACKLGFNYDKSVVAYYVYLLFQTAFRPSELLALKWKHVDF